jgi:SOS-response transcriptional repressor LexA
MTAIALPLNEVLNRLLFQKQIRVTELARKTGVSQPTLQRMVTGNSENPHVSSLKPIADYFNVTLKQLKGIDPIPWLYPITPEEAGWTRVPLLSAEEAVTCKKYLTSKARVKTHEMVMTDVKVSQQAYALRMHDASMEPLFPKGTLLIMDANREPKDRSYVAVALRNYPHAIFRQLLIDGRHRYLKPLSPDFDQYKMKIVSEDDKILGVLLQARRNYEE